MDYYNALVFQLETILEGVQNLWTRSSSLLKVSKVEIPHSVEGFEQCRLGIALE